MITIHHTYSLTHSTPFHPLYSGSACLSTSGAVRPPAARSGCHSGVVMLGWGNGRPEGRGTGEARGRETVKPRGRGGAGAGGRRIRVSTRAPESNAESNLEALDPRGSFSDSSHMDWSFRETTTALFGIVRGKRANEQTSQKASPARSVRADGWTKKQVHVHAVVVQPRHLFLSALRSALVRTR